MSQYDDMPPLVLADLYDAATDQVEKDKIGAALAEKVRINSTRIEGTAELHGAFVWDCNRCGNENFARSVTLEHDQETEDALRDKLGIPDEITGNWMTVPSLVVCSSCSAVYNTTHQGLDLNTDPDS